MAKKKCKPVKKGTEEVEQVQEVKNTQRTASASDKHYIWEHATSKTPAELAKFTGLTEMQVDAILRSTDVDFEPVVEHSEQKAKQIRRFLAENGSVVMTPAQANLDNLVFEENLVNKKRNDFERKYGKCVEYRPI